MFFKYVSILTDCLFYRNFYFMEGRLVSYMILHIQHKSFLFFLFLTLEMKKELYNDFELKPTNTVTQLLSHTAIHSYY